MWRRLKSKQNLIFSLVKMDRNCTSLFRYLLKLSFRITINKHLRSGIQLTWFDLDWNLFCFYWSGLVRFGLNTTPLLLSFYLLGSKITMINDWWNVGDSPAAIFTVCSLVWFGLIWFGYQSIEYHSSSAILLSPWLRNHYDKWLVKCWWLLLLFFDSLPPSKQSPCVPLSWWVKIASVFEFRPLPLIYWHIPWDLGLSFFPGQ